jgi:hypothetical protein
MGGYVEYPALEFKRMQGALELAVRILARDGVRALEGTAYTQDEREVIELVSQWTVAEIRGEGSR